MKRITYYSLTHPQKSIWYTEKMFQQTSISNICATIRFKGEINYAFLEKALNIFNEKNDAVRTKITEVNSTPMQYISPFQYKQFEMIDFSKYDDPLQELYKWDQKQTLIPFDLIESDLFYYALIKLNDREGGIYVKMHHIISDAWSMTLMANQVVEHYSTLKCGQEISQEIMPSYIEYISSEEEYKKTERFIKDKEYWHSKFLNLPEKTVLKSRKINAINSSSKRKTLVTPLKFTKKLKEYCRLNNVSPFPLFVAALSMYINRVSSKNDIVIGTPILNRSDRRERNTVGMFIGTAPIRISLNETIDFKTFSEIASKECMSLLRHQKYPYDLLLKEIREKHNISDNIYDIVLSYQNTQFNKKQHQEEYTTRWHFNGHQSNSLTIHINDREDEGRLIIDYDFYEDLYFVKEIEFIHQHIISLLWHALDNPLKPICRVEMLTEAEKNKILYEFNNTDTDYSKAKTIHQLFEEQVLRTPGKVALILENDKITYRELNEKANQLARKLRLRGVRPDSVVGLLVPRSFELIIAILGILKAGGAYLPIDPDYPEERIKYILEDSGAEILLSQKGLCQELCFDGEVIDLYEKSLYSGNSSNLENINTSDDLIYIIYTSGSTGKPKGVMIEHKGVVNYITWANKVYVREDALDFALYSSISFDLTVTSIFTPILYGNKIVIYKSADDEILIRKVFKDNKAGIVKLTPSHLQLIKDMDNTGSNIKRIILGGEDLKTELCRQIHSSFDGDIEIYNEYGPTETVVGCMIYKYDYQKDTRASVLIGKPSDNTKLFIMDRYMNLVPIGICGELYIAGDGVARGYINRSELTDERFIRNIYGSKVLYKTGDMARWFSKGDVEYLGRNDDQVKVKGYRIEIGEIEKKLLLHEKVNECVVIAVEKTAGDKYLCGYIVSDEEIASSELRRYLSGELPAYMIPSIFIRIDKIPLTPNGKLNIKELPKAYKKQQNDTLEDCCNEIEKSVLTVWKDIFQLEEISVNDDFFELGGDSLLAIQLQGSLLKYGYNFTTQDIYKNRTVSQLAERIVSGKNNSSGNLHSENEAYSLNSGLEKRNFELNNNMINETVQYKNILLVGATGYLGVHILDNLLSDTDSNIYCIIRKHNKVNAKTRLFDSLKHYFGDKYDSSINKRLFIIEGDITIEHLGIEKSKYLELGRNISAIVHTGALVKYYGDYYDFEKVNIYGTKNILDFSLKCRKPVFYVSTMGISGQYLVSHKYDNVTFSENDLYIGQNYMENPYVKSKFEAEKIIKEYIGLGLEVGILRVGNLTGRYEDGYFQKNIAQNSFYNIIKSVISLGAVSSNILNESFDFTPVDYCSKAVVKIMSRKNSIGRTFHLYNHNRMKVSELIELFSRMGIEIEVLDNVEFEKLIKNTLANKLHKEKMYGIINDIDQNNQLKFNTSVFLDSKYTIDYLNRIGFEWPKINIEYIEKILNHMKDVKYIS